MGSYRAPASVSVADVDRPFRVRKSDSYAAIAAFASSRIRRSSHSASGASARYVDVNRTIFAVSSGKSARSAVGAACFAVARPTRDISFTTRRSEMNVAAAAALFAPRDKVPSAASFRVSKKAVPVLVSFETVREAREPAKGDLNAKGAPKRKGDSSVCCRVVHSVDLYSTKAGLDPAANPEPHRLERGLRGKSEWFKCKDAETTAASFSRGRLCELRQTGFEDYYSEKRQQQERSFVSRGIVPVPFDRYGEVLSTLPFDARALDADRDSAEPVSEINEKTGEAFTPMGAFVCVEIDNAPTLPRADGSASYSDGVVLGTFPLAESDKCFERKDSNGVVQPCFQNVDGLGNEVKNTFEIVQCAPGGAAPQKFLAQMSLYEDSVATTGLSPAQWRKFGPTLMLGPRLHLTANVHLARPPVVADDADGSKRAAYAAVVTLWGTATFDMVDTLRRVGVLVSPTELLSLRPDFAERLKGDASAPPIDPNSRVVCLDNVVGDVGRYASFMWVGLYVVGTWTKIDKLRAVEALPSADKLACLREDDDAKIVLKSRTADPSFVAFAVLPRTEAATPVDDGPPAKRARVEEE